MKVLLLGAGAREHALAWKLSQSPLLGELLCAPGHPAWGELARSIAVNPADPAAVRREAERERVDLVVVGPEAPLVAGVSDALAEAGIPCFGPSQAAALLEGSKAFAKQVMADAGIATAGYRVFDKDVEGAVAYARTQSRVVVKADGLAAGKGVIVATDSASAVQAVRSLSALGPAGQRLVLEAFLEGEELSVIALCDGDRYVLLPPAQDHKRVGEGDTGPNTGGMGAYAPVPFFSAALLEDVGRQVIAPTLAVLKKRGIPFRGALYAGLMLTPQGPQVLEFNVRLGDPETQVLMLQLEEDLLPLLDACARGSLQPRALKVHPGASVGVVLASENYPQEPRVGRRIQGLGHPLPDTHYFFSGVAGEPGAWVTAGGRVLTVCARGADLQDARLKAYASAERVAFEGMHLRRDIGNKGLAVSPSR